MELKFLGKYQRKFLDGGNYHIGQTVEERYGDIERCILSYSDLYGESNCKKIVDLIDKNIISLSTPQIANLGKEKTGNSVPLPASCHNIMVGDSIYDIYRSNLEVAILSKLGAGIGIDFSNIRQKGSFVAEDFYSNKKLDWINALVDTSQKVSQNGVRRGFATPYMDIEDVEFYDLLKEVSRNNPDKNSVLIDNTIGINIRDSFIELMNSKDKEAQKRWVALLNARKETGNIYISFIGNMNKNSQPVYKKLGLEINTSNICCVTGDQMVATEYGFKTVKDLSDINKPLRLFDNEGTYSSTAMLYRGNADVYKITLKNGMTHTITSNHELVVRDRNGNTCQQSLDTGLDIGKKVLVQTNKGLFGSENNAGLAFLLGLFLGDGSKSSNSTNICLWENDFDLIPEVESIVSEFYNRESTIIPNGSHLPVFLNKPSGDSGVKKVGLTTAMFNNNGFDFPKDYLPEWILRSDEKTHWQLLRGLFYSDGTVGDYNKGKSYGKPINLSLASIRLDLLKQIQLVCANLGLKAKVYNLRGASTQMLPKNDGTGDYKEYPTKPIYRLVISNKNDLLLVDKNTSFLKRKGVFIEDKVYRDNSSKSSEIVSIEHLGKQDVYCPTVDSEKHLWVCNGLVTSNTEHLRAAVEGHIPTCVLAALNLNHWDTIKADPDIIRMAIFYLNIVTDEYIRLSDGVMGAERARQSVIDGRDIGLGTLGFHDLLQEKGLAFGDVGSRALNKEIYSTIRKYSDLATEELANMHGPCNLSLKAGINSRNASLMMVAPNKTTSFISEMSSLGIEPLFSNIFTKKLAKINHVFKNKHLEKLLESKGKNTNGVWTLISNSLGSVQNLDFLTKEEKDIFLTFSEISPKDIIDLAADRQVYIDMGQSLNLMNRPNYTIKDMHSIHMYAYEKGIKTLYYFYPQAHATIEQEGKKWDACISCAD